MKKICTILAIIAISFLFSCKNAYNELIPNNEQDIISFSLSSEDSLTRSISTDINKKIITVKVPIGTDVTRLLVKASISKQATLFPLTLRYLQEAFPLTDVVDLALRMSLKPEEKSLDKWFLDLYLENPDFKIPPLIFAINFFSPVQFAVIGGAGGVEIYTVKVIYQDGSEPSNPPLPPPPASDEILPQESEKRFLSFNVPPHQKGESIISEDAVKFFCNPGTDVRLLFPQVTVSENCIAVPLTKEYLLILAEKLGLDALSVAQGFLTATNKEAFLNATLAPCDTSTLTLILNKPIDFTEPVQFVVVHRGDKTAKLYTATCLTDGDMPHLKRISFSKFQNPQIMRDAVGTIDEANKTIECTVFYPVEYVGTHPEALHLNVDLGYSGDSAQFEYKGETYAEYAAVPFQPVKITQEQFSLGDAVMKVHVLQDSKKLTYTMKITFKEDADTIRSITDFRFEKFTNPTIKATAIASIVNKDDEGEIKATVLYTSDVIPYNLIPSFITGGSATVSVFGTLQTPKEDSQDFSTTLVYLCVSKDGNYKRAYSVYVDFIKVKKSEAFMKAFSFSIHLNSDIAGNAEGIIDDVNNTITVEIRHSTPVVPQDLIPEFASTGIVSVGGILQTSGFSKHSFRYDVYYKVTSIDDSTIKRTYKVKVNFIYATESQCQLLRFYFTKERNPCLREDVECYISASSYNVFGLLPFGTATNSLIPSFEAYGKVKVNGVEQTSALNAHNFSERLEYVVESEDGKYSKIYKVKLDVAGDIIYLSDNAHGKNNGTSWQDAFTTLEDAIDAANKMTSAPEIWVKGDGFTNKTVRLNKAITLRGGFNGTENRKEDRIRTIYGKLKHLNLTKVQFVGMKGIKMKGAFVFDGISIYKNVESSYLQNFVDFDWVEDDAIANSVSFIDCVVDAQIFLETKKLSLLSIKNSRFDYGSSIVFYNTEDCDFEFIVENSHLNGKVDTMINWNQWHSWYSIGKVQISQSPIMYDFSIYAKDIKLEKFIVSEFEFYSPKILLHVEYSGNCTIDRVTLPSITIAPADKTVLNFENSNIDKINFSHYEGPYEEDLPLVSAISSVRFNNCKMKTVNSINLVVARELNIYNCSCGWYSEFTLAAMNVTIEAATFGTIDTRWKKNEIAVTSIGSNVKNLVANNFFCGYENPRRIPITLNIQWRQGTHPYEEPDEGASHGVHKIENSQFHTLYCLGGDEITLKKVKIIPTHNSTSNTIIDAPYFFPKYSFVILRNLATENSKIHLEEVNGGIREKDPYNASWLRCITNNITVGNSSIENSGVKDFARAEFYAKDSVDVQHSNFATVKTCKAKDENHEFVPVNGYIKDAPGLLLAGKAVNFTKNVLHNTSDEYSKYSPVRCKISCDGELNYNGNTPKMLDLTLYYPKPKTFENERFVAVELLDKHPQEIPFKLAQDNEGRVYFNDCFFSSAFINHRPKVFMYAPKFMGEGISQSKYFYGVRNIIAFSNALRIKGMNASYENKEGRAALMTIDKGENAQLRIEDSHISSTIMLGSDNLIDVKYKKTATMPNSKFFALEIINSTFDLIRTLVHADTSLLLFEKCTFKRIDTFLEADDLNYPPSIVIKNNSQFIIDEYILNQKSKAYLYAEDLEMDNCDIISNISFNHSTKELLFKANTAKINNSRIINTEHFCDVLLSTTEKCLITDSKLKNTGRILLSTYHNLTAYKDEIAFVRSILENSKVYLYLGSANANQQNNFLSTASVLFEDSDIFDVKTFISVDNHHYLNNWVGPIAIKFKYNIENLPQSIKDKLPGGILPPAPLLTEKIGDIIKARLPTTSINRVGYFLNLVGEPSDNSPQKFYGEYR